MLGSHPDVREVRRPLSLYVNGSFSPYSPSFYPSSLSSPFPPSPSPLSPHHSSPLPPPPLSSPSPPPPLSSQSVIGTSHNHTYRRSQSGHTTMLSNHGGVRKVRGILCSICTRQYLSLLVYLFVNLRVPFSFIISLPPYLSSPSILFSLTLSLSLPFPP